MSSADSYTVHDTRGITKVEIGADGIKKEYLISEEDWQRANPKHKDSNCTECTFVQDIANLAILFVDREKRANAGYRPEFVGKFTGPDWTGHSSFYLFRCRKCETVTVDYPHGYHGNFMFLRCGECNERLVLNKSYYREIYSRDNLHIPSFSVIGFLRAVLPTVKIPFTRPKSRKIN